MPSVSYRAASALWQRQVLMSLATLGKYASKSDLRHVVVFARGRWNPDKVVQVWGRGRLSIKTINVSFPMQCRSTSLRLGGAAA